MMWVLQQPGVHLTTDIMSAAASCWGTAMCELLRLKGCPWDADACKQAADYGELDTLRWLHENGCPWDTDKIHTAAAQGGVAIMQYIQQQGVVFSAKQLTEMLYECTHSYTVDFRDGLETAKWLR
eukprot:18803-Heterococcus_DN1.PRE.2